VDSLELSVAFWGYVGCPLIAVAAWKVFEFTLTAFLDWLGEVTQ
jgi:hypothetical protein